MIESLAAAGSKRSKTTVTKLSDHENVSSQVGAVANAACRSATYTVRVQSSAALARTAAAVADFDIPKTAAFVETITYRVLATVYAQTKKIPTATLVKTILK